MSTKRKTTKKEVLYPKGSEWRKWDLHVHSPVSKGFSGDWDKFKTQLKNADCTVIGINDYYSVEGYRKIIEEVEKGSFDLKNKTILPVVEMRMTDSVQNKNSTTNSVTHFNFHIIFNNDIKVDDIENFIKSLECKDSIIGSDYNDKKKRSKMKVSFWKTLEKLGTDKKFKDNFLIWLPYDEYGGIDDIDPKTDGWIKGNFVRKSHILGSGRKKQINFFHWKSDLKKDNTPKFTQKQFGSWLNTKKPCIKGSDSHSHDYPIGKLMDKDSNPTERYCWIKADPTFEGLKQIVYEPEDRVYIGSLPPDQKSPDRVISRIKFDGTKDFPKEIDFNQNLVSIIGSRSSGKSALLAYVAHAIDPEMTENVKKEPGAGISWDEVEFNVEVEWGDQLSQSGKIIYIPQNYLNQLSQNPIKITEMIEPVLFGRHPEIQSLFQSVNDNIENLNNSIRGDVESWFDQKEDTKNYKREIKEIGDKESISELISRYKTKIESLKKTLDIQEDEIKEYQNITTQTNQKEIRISEITKEMTSIEAFLKKDETSTVVDFDIQVRVNPSLDSLPNNLTDEIVKIKGKTTTKLNKDIQKKILEYNRNLETEKTKLEDEAQKIKDDNKELIEKCMKNEHLEDLVKKQGVQEKKLKKINTLQDKITQKNESCSRLTKLIENGLSRRNEELVKIETGVKGLDQKNKVVFGVEFDIGESDIEEISSKFNRQEKSDFVEQKDKESPRELAVHKIRKTPQAFLEAMFSETQKVITGEEITDSAVRALTLTETIRFKATMEEDSIGGFQKSTMTEGRQALFALTLLLNQESETWPLLIDQPEDDLDSRSIYNVIVPYLKEQKKKRQIIMVSHNANLVVGADSEQVIVANKHGSNSENKNGQLFDYLSGSLEFTVKKNDKEKIVLNSQGIKEHSCEILDGGKEAFEKRKNKYNL